MIVGHEVGEERRLGLTELLVDLAGEDLESAAHAGGGDGRGPVAQVSKAFEAIGPRLLHLGEAGVERGGHEAGANQPLLRDQAQHFARVELRQQVDGRAAQRGVEKVQESTRVEGGGDEELALVCRERKDGAPIGRCDPEGEVRVHDPLGSPGGAAGVELPRFVVGFRAPCGRSMSGGLEKVLVGGGAVGERFATHFAESHRALEPR